MRTKRWCGFPLWAVWSGGLVAELLLNGLQFLPESFHFLSQCLCGCDLGFGCAWFPLGLATSARSSHSEAQSAQWLLLSAHVAAADNRWQETYRSIFLLAADQSHRIVGRLSE